MFAPLSSCPSEDAEAARPVVTDRGGPANVAVAAFENELGVVGIGGKALYELLEWLCDRECDSDDGRLLNENSEEVDFDAATALGRRGGCALSDDARERSRFAMSREEIPVPRRPSAAALYEGPPPNNDVIFLPNVFFVLSGAADATGSRFGAVYDTGAEDVVERERCEKVGESQR